MICSGCMILLGTLHPLESAHRVPEEVLSGGLPDISGGEEGKRMETLICQKVSKCRVVKDPVVDCPHAVPHTWRDACERNDGHCPKCDEMKTMRYIRRHRSPRKPMEEIQGYRWGVTKRTLQSPQKPAVGREEPEEDSIIVTTIAGKKYGLRFPKPHPEETQELERVEITQLGDPTRQFAVNHVLMRLEPDDASKAAARFSQPDASEVRLSASPAGRARMKRKPKKKCGPRS